MYKDCCFKGVFLFIKKLKRLSLAVCMKEMPFWAIIRETS